jgi:CRISPR-associated protein Cas2
MSFNPVEVSEYKTMWMIVMFDLPVKTKKDRRSYAQFKSKLLGEGFNRLQYSVYARPFISEDSSGACRSFLTRQLPSEGHVRFLFVTDRQFGKMQCFLGKKVAPVEVVAQQYLLF